MGNGNGNGRARAVVLAMVQDQEAVAEQIMALDVGEDELVVVRVDFVDGDLGNLIASIDADAEVYEEVRADIESIVGDQDIWFFIVTAYNPDPPHDASGFITQDEAERGEAQIIGRQDNSPGFNPWG